MKISRFKETSNLTKRAFSKLNDCVGQEYRDCERGNPTQLLSTQVNNCINTQLTSRQTQKLSMREKIAKLCHLSGESDNEYEDPSNSLNEDGVFSVIEEIDNDII